MSSPAAVLMAPPSTDAVAVMAPVPGRGDVLETGIAGCRLRDGEVERDGGRAAVGDGVAASAAAHVAGEGLVGEAVVAGI
jgi:hypothetical protein